MAGLPDGMKMNPLYKELGELGRKQKSLRPAGLLSYKALLYCAEVSRRVARNATDLQRAEAARDAITGIVAGIGTEQDRRIGEASLCTTPEYVDVPVKDRADHLYRRHGITRDTYTHQRQWVVAHIVQVLEGPRPERKRQLSHPGADNPIGYNRFCLWRDAFTLHCAGLASLYVLQDEYIPEGEYPPLEACAKALFDALTIFLYGTYYSCIAHPTMMEEWIKDCLDDDNISWLLRTVRQLNSYCPLLQYTEEEFESLLFDFRRLASQGGIHIRDLYALVWKPWYFTWRGSADVLVSIKRITGQSGAIASVLRDARCIGVNQPLEESIYDDAFDVVKHYYGARVHRPSIDGDALSFDKYCKTESPRLVKSELP